MYKTGDLVEIVNDKMYFCGRIDNQIEFVNELPKNPNGKVDRKELESRV